MIKHFRYLNNNRGVALLIVMAVLSVVIMIAFLVLQMATQERKLVNDYAGDSITYQVAEAAADLAICEWVDYINSLHTNGVPMTTVKIENYVARLEGTGGTTGEKEELIKKFNEEYFGDSTLRDIDITYQYEPLSGDMKERDFNQTNVNLTIKVIGKYNRSSTYNEYPLYVELMFCKHGDSFTYKGSLEPKP